MITTLESENNFDRSMSLFERVQKKYENGDEKLIHYSKQSDKSGLYGILKEHNTYVIKVNPKNKKVVKDFLYIDGYENRKKYTKNTLQEAIKFLHLYLNEEKYVVEVPVPTEKVDTDEIESTDGYDVVDGEVSIDEPQNQSVEDISQDVEPEQTESESELEIQSLVGKLGQELRTEIENNNQKFTVGMFKAVLAAAKDLDSENKAEVKDKADEVLAIDEPPVAENILREDGAGKTTSAQERYDVISSKIKSELGDKYNFSVEIYGDKLYILPKNKIDGEIWVKVNNNFTDWNNFNAQAPKTFAVAYLDDASTAKYANADHSEETAIRKIVSLMRNKFIESTKDTVNNKKGNDIKYVPSDFVEMLKSKYGGEPKIQEIKASSKIDSAAIRFISKGDLDLFVFYNVFDGMGDFDLYIVDKKNVPNFIKSNTSEEYKYLDVNKESDLYLRIDQWLNDVKVVAESTTKTITKKELMEMLQWQKK